MLYLEEKLQNRGKHPYNFPIYYEIFPILKKNCPIKCLILGSEGT